MSSETQIKKRRDNKKKRKDEVIEEKENVPLEQAQVHITPKTTQNGDLNIHIHKEPSTGGGLGAKLVFFALLTILTGLIAILISEHRESTEFEAVDTPRYSKLSKRSIDDLAASVEESQENTYEEEEIDEGDNAEHDQNSAENESDDMQSTEEDGDEDTQLTDDSHDDSIEEEENVTPETTEHSEEVPDEQEEDDTLGESDEEDDEPKSEDDTDLANDSSTQENTASDGNDSTESESQESSTVRLTTETERKEEDIPDEPHSPDNYHSVKINQEESESENDQESDGVQAVYQFADVTNSNDWIIREKLDQANQTLENE